MIVMTFRTGPPLAAQSGLFVDPYQAYPTRLVDPVNGVDTPNGTAYVQSWGGKSQSWQTYRTIQYAITDYFVNAGVRLGLIGGATYSIPNPNSSSGTFTGTITAGSNTITGVTVPGNLVFNSWMADNMGFLPFGAVCNGTNAGANTVSICNGAVTTGTGAVTVTYGINNTVPAITFPNVSVGTLGPGSQRIIQGDPASPALPLVDGSLTLGGDTSLFYPGWNFTAPYTVFRKVEISSVNGWCSTGIALSGCANSTVEFCHIHDLHNASQDNNAGVNTSGGQVGMLVQNCKIHDVYERFNTWTQHAILNYFSTGVVRNCEMWNVASGFFSKGAPTVAPLYWTVTRNIVHDVTLTNGQGGFLYNEQGANDPPNQNDVISYNLFYNMPGLPGLNQGAQDKIFGTQAGLNQNINFFNNTMAEDCGAGVGFVNCNGLNYYNNVHVSATQSAINASPLVPTAWAINTAYSLNQVMFVAASAKYYICTTAGTSASSGTGPSGTGTGIADGTCVWSYDAGVDRPLWAQGTAYPLGKGIVVFASGAIYKCSTAGTSASSGTGPSGTGTGIADGTCTWDYLGPGANTFAVCDYNAYRSQKWIIGNNSPSTINITTYSSGAAGNRWSTFHTDYPARMELAFNPDAHAQLITSFVSGPSDVNFVDPSARNYALKPTSPLKGTGLNGADPGYDPTNIGPGW